MPIYALFARMMKSIIDCVGHVPFVNTLLSNYSSLHIFGTMFVPITDSLLYNYDVAEMSVCFNGTCR
jgi:hypothetical protein